jgi:multiple sugar transport system ATP-binding protein
MPKVSFSGIVKRFGAVTVLRDLDLEVEDGEFLVLLGPSGCGKTTLLNLLAGLQEVTDGVIRIGERDVTDLDPKDRGLAMVFQSYALYPTKTVRGNLKFGLAAQRLDRAEVARRIDWAAKLLQIDGLMERKPAELSGGQRQRVAIGRALVKHVGVCLFDEPLSNLDAKLRTEMRLEIKRLHQELRQTIIYVTHDQVEAMTMASRIAIMDRGVIQQIATPDEIYSTPRNLFVAGFIGSPPMNILAARLSVAGAAVRARHGATGIDFDLSRYPFARPPHDQEDVLLGLRPEHFVPGRANGVEPAAAFSLPVRYTEKTGGDCTAFLDAGSGLMAVRLATAAAAAPMPGARLAVHFPKDRLSVFDARTQLRI